MKSAGKTALTLFFDNEGPLLMVFFEQVHENTGQYYAALLEKLHNVITEKKRGKITAGVLLLDLFMELVSFWIIAVI